MISYEKQKERQKQQRLARGLKPLGRPFKTIENRNIRCSLLNELQEIENIVIIENHLTSMD